MAKEQMPLEEKKARIRKPESEEPTQRHASDTGAEASGLAALQQLVGNQAVQRLLAQRSGDGPQELEEETAGRINRERGGGQPLDGGVQAQIGETMGYDFGDVRVHNTAESDTLNQELGAKAFTSGHDIFFREGAYAPHTASGQELIAHELTHVVQQSTGAVHDSGGMTLHAPGDVYEQEADSVADLVTSGVQRQIEPEEEEEEEVQMQAEEEEEELQAAQMQEMEDEDEFLSL